MSTYFRQEIPEVGISANPILQKILLQNFCRNFLAEILHFCREAGDSRHQGWSNQGTLSSSRRYATEGFEWGSPQFIRKRTRPIKKFPANASLIEIDL